jgi:hypothetical protein
MTERKSANESLIECMNMNTRGSITAPLILRSLKAWYILLLSHLAKLKAKHVCMSLVNHVAFFTLRFTCTFGGSYLRDIPKRLYSSYKSGDSASYLDIVG